MGTQLFDSFPSKVDTLLRDVRTGRIGLPDLQRPFVWSDAKVRDLLDSMLKGYLVGFVMIWEAPDSYENVSHIGNNDKMYSRPSDLVIDGQQRLTALLSALYGTAVKDKKYQERVIKISYHPLKDTELLAVWTKAIDNDIEWIPCISGCLSRRGWTVTIPWIFTTTKSINGKDYKASLFTVKSSVKIS